MSHGTFYISGYGGMVHLDDCKFHECVNLEAFPDTRILTVRPPEGEVSPMSVSACATYY